MLTTCIRSGATPAPASSSARYPLTAMIPLAPRRPGSVAARMARRERFATSPPCAVSTQGTPASPPTAAAIAPVGNR